jgi:hypothetical protein
MAGNTEIWDALKKTDPAQTKKFSRSGGFKGTAIKPIYTEHKMTEQFGACGIGWGIEAPTFTTSVGSEGQVAVYCTVAIWVTQDGKRSAPIYGVGGDMVVVKQSSGLRTDDEAFKKAFTDAVGNAMKHLGMSADVHMGLFDDSKYVQERQSEEARQHDPETGEFVDDRPEAPRASKAMSRAEYAEFQSRIRMANSKTDLTLLREELLASNMPGDWYDLICVEWDSRYNELKQAALERQKAGGSLSAQASLDRQFAETVRN